MVALSYVQKLSEKVRRLRFFFFNSYLFQMSAICYLGIFLIPLFFIKVSLATDLMYNYMSRDVTSSVGYDYILRQVYLQIYSTVSEL